MRRIKAKARQGTGKVRRFFQAKFRKTFVERQEAMRQGECARCGTCCKLLFNCPFLKSKKDGSTYCAVHHKRPINCSIFPISHSDIRDRDSKNRSTKCGYSFPNH